MLLQILALVPPAFAAAGGYVQVPGPSTASFTMYSGCQMPACGVTASGYTAAISQLAFGSVPGLGPGDACGRCFSITGTADPYSPSYTGPFGATIVVKVCLLYGLSSKSPDPFQVTDMCPAAGNEQWSALYTARKYLGCLVSVGADKPLSTAPTRSENRSSTLQSRVLESIRTNHVHSFDLCEDSGASGVFFPSGHGALTGTWEEVSCSQWLGSGDGPSEFTGACLIGDQAPLWPSTGCGNQGLAPGATGTPASTVSKGATSTVSTVSTSGTSTSTSTGPTQSPFGQCGGIGWSSPTACASPDTCVVINEYYSQCLP
uniref:Endoglucanase V-like protein n=1 Tax=Mycena chlorophos TaxID=658473 RepID=A0ABQ0LVG9_MYCCL|nr:endoglucanase V-like protein [Mycena chlorophos]